MNATTAELERAVRLSEAKRDLAVRETRIDGTADAEPLTIFSPERAKELLAWSDSRLDAEMTTEADAIAVLGWHGLSDQEIKNRQAMRRERLREQARNALLSSGTTRTDGVTRHADVTRVTRHDLCLECLNIRIDSTEHVCTTTTKEAPMGNEEQHEKTFTELVNAAVDRAMSQQPRTDAGARGDEEGPEILYRRKIRKAWEQPLIASKPPVIEGAVVRTDADDARRDQAVRDQNERQRLHADLRAARDVETVRLDDASAAPADPVSRAHAEMLEHARSGWRKPLRASRRDAGGGFDGSGGGSHAA